MTTFEKLKLGLIGLTWVMGLVISIWLGSMIQDVTNLMEATSTTIERIESLIEIGPEGIAEVGDGVKAGVETAGEGLGNAAENFMSRFKGDGNE